jgi:hypothetical protein
MADTDEEQSVALDPEQREQGDDDTEAASERRAVRAREQTDERLAAGLTRSEEARRRAEEDELARAAEEDAEAHAERLELAAKEEQERQELRSRDELLAKASAEATRAYDLAYADEVQRDRYRKLAQGEQRQAVSDLAHGRHELDEAAANPDAPGAAGLAADGRRYERASGIEDRRAANDHRIADGYDASARDWRTEARREQPDPVEAVRNPPAEAPEAQLPHARRHVRSRVKNRNTPDPSKQPDLGLGD